MNKPVLLLLHGALASAKQFSAIAPLLEPHFEVHTLNFEGHGGEIINRDFSVDHFVQNLLQTIDSKPWQQVNIFGYSMGGYVALKAALKDAGRIHRIATLATKFDWNEEATQREVQMLDPVKIAEKIPHYAEALREEHHPTDWKEVMKQTAGMMQRLAAGERLTEKELRKIETPVYIGVGDRDRMVGIEESKWAAKHLQRAEVEVLEGIEHPLQKFEVSALCQWIVTALT